MNKMKRSFTLSEQADLLLKAIAQRLGISQTAVLEIIIREKADQVGIAAQNATKDQ